MGISFEEYTRQLRQQQSQAPKPTQNDMRRAINNIQKAAEAGNTASASGVQRKEEEESPFARHLEQIRQAAEQQRAYAEAARKPSAHSASSRNLYSQAQNAATPFSLFGMGDQTLDAEQGRELARQAETRYADQLRREQERLDEEARQARERMAEAQRISQTKEALDRAPQGAQNALGNIYSQAEQRQSSLEGTPYADILRRGDYGRYAQAGESRLGLGAETDRTYDYINDINGFRARADEQAVMMDDAQRLGIYGLMTDDEIGVYNYLYATLGREAAEGYLEELTPEMNRQYYSGLKNSTLEDVDDGEAGLSWNEAGASALTALQQPVRSVNSAMANLEDAYRTATGKGIDPYSQLRTTSRLTQDVRGGISDDMGEVGQFAYNTAMSALDSTINALVAQGVGEGLGFGGDLASAADVERLKKAVNVLGSLTMSNEVMAMSVAESKEKGYSDVGALSLGFARGAIEYLSEKIGGDWIINKAKGNPTSLLYALKSAMVPEGVEEVMSDAMNEVINNIIDPIYGTEESYIRNAFKHWKDQGAGNGKALAMTLATVIQQEILSFAGGAFAAAGSGTTNYRSNTIAFNDTANRLNTSTEGVVQLMRNIGAEDVFQVAQLADLYGANSAEQLEAKVKEVGDAAAAIDAKMQAQAAGNATGAEGINVPGKEKENGPGHGLTPAPTGTETTGQQTETAAAGQAENDTARIDNENAPAGTAEALESAAQTGAEGGRIENGNAQINNGNAQINNGNAQLENGNAQNGAEGAQVGTENAQPAEKPDLNAVRSKAAQGLDKLTDAELQVYTEYMQQQVEQSENSQGYADNLKQTLREGLADAQAEAQRRGEEGKTTGEQATTNKPFREEDDASFSVDMSSTSKKAPHGLVLDAIRSHFSKVRSDQAVKSITGNEFQKTDNDQRSLKAKIKEFFESLGNKVTRDGFGDIALTSAGVHDSLEHGYGPLKAATFEALPDVLKKGKLFNADPNHELHPYDSFLIIAPVNVGTGESTKRCYVGAIVIRDVNTQRYKIHEVLTETENGTSSDKSEAHQKGSGLRYDVPSDNNILQSDENINPQNEGGDSQPREAEENGTGEKGSEQAEAAADLSQNQKIAENETAEKVERTAGENPARQEAREANSAMADELADGSWSSVEPGKAIDIMPGEGEEAVSSANGLTEEDNRRLDTYINAADLFGPTNAEKERTATKTAVDNGNKALRVFAETMSENPMDLYAQQNPVGKKTIPGEDMISTSKEAKKKTLREKASEGWHGFIRSMVNEADAIHQIGIKTGNRAIDGMYFYAKAGTMRAQQWIQKQRTSFNAQTTGKSLNEIFDPIRDKGADYYRDFQLYMYHTLNVERMSRSPADALQKAQERVRELAAANTDLASMDRDDLRAMAERTSYGGEDAREYLDELDAGTAERIRAREYLDALEARDRAKAARNKPVFSYEIDADASRQIANDLLTAHPEFKEEAKKVYGYVDDLLQYRVDAGLITEEARDRLKKAYPHYVPVMYETSPEDDSRTRKGNVQVSSTVKSAKGSDGLRGMEQLHFALARQTLAAMKNAGYQQLGAEVLREYEDNGQLMGRYVNHVEESDAVWDESMADNDDVNVPYENVISVFQDGKKYDLTLSDDLNYAFKSLQSGKNGPQDLKAAVAANNLFKKLCTAYNPLFMITNPIRDVQDALFYSTDTKRWIRNYPKAIAQISGSGNYWQMYQSLGGVQNSYFDWATGETAGKMGKVETLNLAIEQAPRLAEFMTVLENAKRNNGGEFTQADLMEAFNAAAEVTTNFARGGTMGKWINRNLVPFWNPGVQGLSKAVRTATEAKSFKAWAGLALKAAALGMLPELLNGLLYRDDDEWDVIDDQMKMDYYLFKTSDGVWIKIPKGRMLAALSMPVVGAQEAMRGDDVNWGKLTKSAFGSIAPNNPFESNLLSTAMQAQLHDPDDPGKTWYGGNIESRRLQSYAPGERYDESTDAISKWLGGKLGISPKKINYVIDQYSGVLGDLVLPYLTPKAERGLYLGDSGVAVPFSNAFMSRFTTDTVTSNTISNEYYGLLDELGYNAKDGDKPSAIAERYMNRAGGQVTEFYAKIREIENDPKLTDAEKSKLTRELRKQLNEYEQQVTEDAGKYLEAAQKYMDEHPEYDYSDDDTVDAFVEGYNSQQTSEKYYIDADQARSKMKDEVYREVNREHFGAEYALQTYSKDVYEKAKAAHEESGVSYEDYYDFYFGKRYLFADKDEEGKSIAGSKKEKIVNLIDGMDIPDEQKDELYLSAGYKEDSLEDAPWNNGTGMYTGSVGSSGIKIRVPKGHEATYKKIVDDNLEALQGSAAYKAADPKGQKALVQKLQEYATVQAMKEADPDYSPAGTSHGWTVWADTAVKAGISLSDAIGHMTALGAMKADYDQYGKAITGSKKDKVCEYIDGLTLTDEQKDTLYLYVYAQNSLKYTPWHGYKGKPRRGRSGGRRGRGGGKRTSTRTTAGTVTAAATRSSGGIDVSKLFGGSAKAGNYDADASRKLLEIIDKYYGGDAWAAAMDGGRAAKGKTKVDFKL